MIASVVTAAETSKLRLTSVDPAIRQACARIAPTWPLDRFIAVNPFWEMVEEPFSVVSAKLVALSGARLLMPRAWFRNESQAGRLSAADLEDAISESGSSATVGELESLMKSEQPLIAPFARVMDIADASRDLAREMSWRDFVTHSSSQFCAAYFDDGQARLRPDHSGGLYASWRRQALVDRSPAFLMGFDDYLTIARELPETAHEMVSFALRELNIPVHEHEFYFTGLLLDLNGWAAWCSYRRWTARLSGGDDDSIVELLAIRLAWEWMLLRRGGSSLVARWPMAMATWTAKRASAARSQTNDWLLQKALEIAWQREACRQLPSGFAATQAAETPALQVAFCIDVRSEVFRRALEAQSPSVQTIGFAGFFGMPIDYQEIASTTARPQLPGLLAPRLRATDACLPNDVAERRAARLDVRSAWKAFKTSAVSSFGFVESMGLFFGGQLLAETLGSGGGGSPKSAGLTRAEDAKRKPRLTARADGESVSLEDRCALAEGMLRAMSLTRRFARVVALLGHGSQTRNNPHGAGLDCGACCGQTGEVNARVAAALLNEPDVRVGLAARGIDIPLTTRFVSGLHNTMTDNVTLYELDELPASHLPDVATLHEWLTAASHQARRERSPNLGLAHLSPDALLNAVDDRARDWAQVRPEWGLANNAAFVIAPRERTRHINFGGRSFLHDYRFEEDKDCSVLELIMTAPMVVAHWINLQYYASTVDNVRYGSGNKVLHNVVGGHLGVFEGNGGDLRIGLPMQSLHDGERWIHTPLRLSVFIEAPCSAVDAVVEKHAKVRALVENEWLSLFQLDAEAGVVRAYRDGAWTVHTASGLFRR